MSAGTSQTSNRGQKPPVVFTFQSPAERSHRQGRRSARLVPEVDLFEQQPEFLTCAYFYSSLSYEPMLLKGIALLPDFFRRTILNSLPLNIQLLGQRLDRYVRLFVHLNLSSLTNSDFVEVGPPLLFVYHDRETVICTSSIVTSSPSFLFIH